MAVLPELWVLSPTWSFENKNVLTVYAQGKYGRLILATILAPCMVQTVRLFGSNFAFAIVYIILSHFSFRSKKPCFISWKLIKNEQIYGRVLGILLSLIQPSVYLVYVYTYK